MKTPAHSGYKVCFCFQALSICGKNLQNSSTALSTKIVVYPRFPYLGKSQRDSPYMGGTPYPKTEQICEFSTGEGTYPQINASYPQKSCPDNHF